MSNGRMTRVFEAVVAVEGEAGDDGTVWTLELLQEIVQLTNQRQDARAWMETRPDGRHQVRIRAEAPGSKAIAGTARGDGDDLERLRKASEKRLRRSEKLQRELDREAARTGVPTPIAPALGTFRVRSSE
jgi:hypothetical protein